MENTINVKENEVLECVERLLNEKVKEIVCKKRGDFTAVFRCVFCGKYRGKDSVIVKLCREPLDIESEIYMLVNSFAPQMSPKQYLSYQLKDFRLIVLEDINDSLWKKNRRNILNILVKTIEFHDCFANMDLFDNTRLLNKNNIKSIKQLIMNELLEIQKENLNYTHIIMLILSNVNNLLNIDDIYIGTLVHGDLYFDNVLWDSMYYIIDWGFAHIGLEYEDIATLLEKNNRKNKDLNLSMEEKIDIYCEAYKIAKGYELNSNQAIRNLMYGSILSKINFLKWILYRIKTNYWKGDSAEMVENLLEDLLDCTIYFKNFIKNEY